jgi:pimeloyl-ACP methyl ester carboxylesterase
MAPGPPIALIHGMATSFDRTWVDNGWVDLITEAGRQVVRVDLLGHGNAPKPHDPAAFADFEDHALGQLPLEPVDAIGFSLGARTLLVLASRHPERFRRIVVAGVGRNLFERDEAHGRAIVEAVTGTPDPENPEAMHFAALAESPDVDRASLAAMFQREGGPEITLDSLAPVTHPVLVVLGDRDFAGPADPLLAAIPQATLVTLRNVDHFATPKDFGFIDAALDFLDAQPF